MGISKKLVQTKHTHGLQVLVFKSFKQAIIS